MHSEYAYTQKFPARLFFCCIVEPGKGGETPLADNRKILKKLDPAIVNEFRTKRVKYLRNLHGGNGFGLSWQAAFQTADRSQVEQYCRDMSIDYEWKTDGGLRLENTGSTIPPSDYPTNIYESLLKSYQAQENDYLKRLYSATTAQSMFGL